MLFTRARLAVSERRIRTDLASSELRQCLQARVEEIEAENDAETRRVFGELSVALEEGARRNIEQLVENMRNAREEKERHLSAHSERVVGEAMER